MLTSTQVGADVDRDTTGGDTSATDADADGALTPTWNTMLHSDNAATANAGMARRIFTVSSFSARAASGRALCC